MAISKTLFAPILISLILLHLVESNARVPKSIILLEFISTFFSLHANLNYMFTLSFFAWINLQNDELMRYICFLIIRWTTPWWRAQVPAQVQVQVLPHQSWVQIPWCMLWQQLIVSSKIKCVCYIRKCLICDSWIQSPNLIGEIRFLFYICLIN